MNLVRGYWEAKDTADKLETEIEKKRKAGNVKTHLSPGLLATRPGERDPVCAAERAAGDDGFIQAFLVRQPLLE